jgi:hypothetical protein
MAYTYQTVPVLRKSTILDMRTRAYGLAPVALRFSRHLLPTSAYNSERRGDPSAENALLRPGTDVEVAKGNDVQPVSQVNGSGGRESERVKSTTVSQHRMRTVASG